SPLKAPFLPSKPLRTTSALVGKGYPAAGQAGACLHTMSVLQAYQADLLKELDECDKIKREEITELRRAADLSLRATKETARAIGRSMAAMVAAERHLWLTLSDMKEKDRVFLLDAPLAPSGLFGDAVNSVVDRYQEACKQAALFRRVLALGAAGWEQLQPSTSSSYRAWTETKRAGCTAFHGVRDHSANPAGVPGRSGLRGPGNVAELGSSPPLWGSPAGEPLQDTELAVQTNPEAGLERLVPLVDYLAAWKLLPNVSAWVLHTIERDYRIQFGAPPSSFNGVFPTLVGPEQGLVMEQEVDTLLRKEAIEVVPPHDSLGFKASTSLSKSVEPLDADCQSEDWFVTIDLKVVYFHVSILPHHRKGKAYQYRVLPFGLALSPRTFTKCVVAALAPLLSYIDDWLILAQSEQMATEHQEKTTYLGVVWDSTTMQARLSPARIESILTAVARAKEGRSLTVKQFQQLLGLMAAASNVIPFGLLYMRPLQWWLRTKGFSPRGNPFCMIKVMRRCLHALDMALCWEFLVTTSCLEMLAVFWALKHFLPDLIGRHELVRTDNTA
ncbi:hypothetical protein M9458_037781, partial [Cirrhinus mrigala]